MLKCIRWHLTCERFLHLTQRLSAWWETVAQAYLASRGFANRQVRNTTANKGTRYEWKIVGDFPEMCRALDSHGFDYLKADFLTDASITSLFLEDDSRRFQLGTPPRLLASVKRTRQMTLTIKHLVEDIELLNEVLGKIIEEFGYVMQHEEFRGLCSGRHAEGSGQ